MVTVIGIPNSMIDATPTVTAPDVGTPLLLRKLAWALLSFWTGFICLINFDAGLWLIGLGVLAVVYQWFRRMGGYGFEEGVAFVAACLSGIGILAKFGPEPIPLAVTFLGVGLAISLDLLYLRQEQAENQVD